MRTLILAGLTMVTVASAGAADAQRIGGAGAPYPMPGRGMPQQPGGNVPVNLPPPPMVQAPGGPTQDHPRPGVPTRGYPTGGYSVPSHQQPGRPNPGYPNLGRPGGYPNGGYPGQGYPRPGGSRWGGQIGGHWQGGMHAPGGWDAYRRPSRGYRVPNYWISPSFFIGDFGSYGLSAPPEGYNWYRYYDDAVLLDGRGRVYDSVGGLDWYGGGYGYDDGGAGGYATADGGTAYAEGGAGESGYSASPYATGYTPLPPVTRNGSVTTYQTGGYPGYGGATTTVVTIQPAETVTTTTTEYVETTRYVAPRRVYRPVRWHYHRPVRRSCGCQVEQPIRGS